MTIIAGYNIHVRLEAVDPEGRIVEAAMATRNASAESPRDILRPVFNEAARRCADVAQQNGWEEIPADLPPPLDCVECGAALMVSTLRCSKCLAKSITCVKCGEQTRLQTCRNCTNRGDIT